MAKRTTDWRLTIREEVWSIFADFGGEQFSDALRNTLAVTVPLIIFFYLGMPQVAIGIATGTLLTSPTDIPGNRSDKLQGAWIGILLFVLISFITVLCLSNIIILCLWTGLLTFSLMMGNVFGQRVGAIGSMGVILAAFTIGLHPVSALNYALYIGIGAAWYQLISLTQIMLLPYRSLHRALRKCTKNTAALMKLRATGYDPSASLSGFNEQNILLHLKVNAGHELIRRLLLSDSFAMQEKSEKGKILLEKSMALIDLYEQVSAVHHDYPYLRRVLASSPVLELIGNSIVCLAEQLENRGLKNDKLLNENIAKLQALTKGEGPIDLIGKLTNNLIQTRLLVDRVKGKEAAVSDPSLVKFHEFLQDEGFGWNTLLRALKISSPTFRFALRLSLLLALSILLLYIFPEGHYGYWLPLTLMVVSRPGYGATKKRNIERLIGTFSGLLLGWMLMDAGIPTPVKLIFSAVFLYIFFAFLNSRYWISAMGITAAVVLCLSVYHGNPLDILSSRLLYTLLGCVMGLLATFLFPIWQSGRLKELFFKVLIANRAYLYQVSISNNEKDRHQVRLARKRSYQSLSVLSEGMELSASEPKWRRRELIVARQVQLLCFQCNGLIASIGSEGGNNVSINNSYYLEEMDSCIAQFRDSNLADWKNVSSKTTSLPQPMELGVVLKRLKGCF